MSATRRVRGITFVVHSPSIWQALWPPVYVIYTSHGWGITSASGEPLHTRPFPDLIEAINIISRSVEK
jgi:hypothetical protein